jgi:LuxR family quorum-sensing system transcriptional regulator ExpR
MKAELTKRELQVLAQVSIGQQRHEVARQLGVAESTIKWHSTNIKNKLGAVNSAHAVALAFRAGVLQ